MLIIIPLLLIQFFQLVAQSSFGSLSSELNVLDLMHEFGVLVLVHQILVNEKFLEAFGNLKQVGKAWGRDVTFQFLHDTPQEVLGKRVALKREQLHCEVVLNFLKRRLICSHGLVAAFDFPLLPVLVVILEHILPDLGEISNQFNALRVQTFIFLIDHGQPIQSLLLALLRIAVAVTCKDSDAFALLSLIEHHLKFGLDVLTGPEELRVNDVQLLDLIDLAGQFIEFGLEA